MKLLSLLYRILKMASASMSAEEPQPASSLYSPDTMKATEAEIESVLLQAYREGYIDGLHAVEIDGQTKPRVLMNDSFIHLTIKGMEYVEDNSLMKKIAEKMKAVKDITPRM